MTKDEALKLALEALTGNWTNETECEALHAKHMESITAIKEALAQPEQEPVACVGTNGELMWLNKPKVIYSKPIPLYTTPPQRKPLSDVEIWNTYKNLWMFHPAEEPRLAGDVLKFARAIEQAHGIKE